MDLISYRRLFHKIPELGFEEVKTTKEIIKILENLNCKLYYGKAIYEDGAESDMSDIEKGYTGVVAEFGKAPYFLFRADIDALKIKETEDVTHIPNLFGFASTNNNMHACGHDGHIALALSLCERFSESGDSVRVLFQPAEEGGTRRKKHGELHYRGCRWIFILSHRFRREKRLYRCWNYRFYGDY